MDKVSSSAIVALLAQLADALDRVSKDLQTCEMATGRTVRIAAARGQARLVAIQRDLDNVTHEVMRLGQQP